MSTAVSLPIRGTPTAPRFTHSKSREISRYFEDVELLVSQARLTSDRDKIDATVCYADFDISDLWQSLPQFTAQPPNYVAFKSAVLSLYPHADLHDNKFTISSLNDLVFRTRQSGIRNLEDLGQYHRQFLHISSFLISKSRLSDIDSQRRFVMGFSDDLLVKILARLQIQFLDHDPDSPWPIRAVYDAACFNLRSLSALPSFSFHIPVSSPSSSCIPSLDTPSHSSSSLGPAPLNDLSTLISTLSQGINQAVTEILRQQQYQCHTTPSNRQQRRLCCFCNASDHLIRNCELVNEYIRNGKAQRNDIGKVVLPSGRYVASNVPGTCLKEKIDEFHRLNSISPPLPSFYHSVLSNTRPLSHSPSSYLSTQSRIEAIEAELTALRARRDQLQSLSSTSSACIPEPLHHTVSVSSLSSPNIAVFASSIAPTSSSSSPASHQCSSVKTSPSSEPIVQKLDLDTQLYAAAIASNHGHESPPILSSSSPITLSSSPLPISDHSHSILPSKESPITSPIPMHSVSVPSSSPLSFSSFSSIPLVLLFTAFIWASSSSLLTRILVLAFMFHQVYICFTPDFVSNYSSSFLPFISSTVTTNLYSLLQGFHSPLHSSSSIVDIHRSDESNVAKIDPIRKKVHTRSIVSKLRSRDSRFSSRGPGFAPAFVVDPPSARKACTEIVIGIF
ncbi:hypothetical protein CVT24_004714 [Panaeolus cyanescens]|uniref:CCHC-type domain-containing protein n=1 Tax=Panaeolus cyanescens TaxID=181874 RepID=A0A409X3N0_9AGAR|nr:hypothetical protein CVT24_004714 [Panaeolus cyanescens]